VDIVTVTINTALAALLGLGVGMGLLLMIVGWRGVDPARPRRVQIRRRPDASGDQRQVLRIGLAVAVGLLIAGGAAIAVSLVVRPPRDGRAAVVRIAVGLAMMFALSPATRFGYFAYPVGLVGWLALSSPLDTLTPEVPA